MTTPKWSVLIAEDHDDVRRLMKVRLEEKGYQVMEARNGLEAVELAPLHNPDLILMDLRMPVLDGFEATRRLRQIPATTSIPIVGFSSLCDGWHEEALAAGCDDCILKPVDDKELTKILERFLRPPT